MGRVSDNRHVLTCCFSDQQAKNLLPHILEQLEICESLLVKQLDGKRSSFPRFYFVSDRLLLEMISEGCNPLILDDTVHSIFEEIKSVTIDEDNAELVTHLNAKRENAEETFELGDVVETQREIEIFLVDLASEVGRSLRNMVLDLQPDKHTLLQSIETFPLQVCIIHLQIKWTRDCQGALERASDKNVMLYTAKRQESALSDVLSLLSDEYLKKRFTVSTLIVLQMNQRDRFDGLVRSKATSPLDFDFQKLLRYSWRDETMDVTVSVADVNTDYGFEYLGLKDPIVATPQSDRCYLAVASALGSGMGSLIMGPRAAGKSESIKGLGKAMGRFVFSCHGTELMEIVFIENILKGIAASGAWACINEFTGIDAPVLSACAQQIWVILHAIRERRTEFVFSDGTEVSLDNKCGILVTSDEVCFPTMLQGASFNMVFWSRKTSFFARNTDFSWIVVAASCWDGQKTPLGSESR